MKKLFTKILCSIGALLTAIAMLSVSSASTIILHQPKEPKCIKK